MLAIKPWAFTTYLSASTTLLTLPELQDRILDAVVLLPLELEKKIPPT
jgi:hypothetical protein